MNVSLDDEKSNCRSSRDNIRICIVLYLFIYLFEVGLRESKTIEYFCNYCLALVNS